MTDKETLYEFLSMPLANADAVFNKFKSIEGAEFYDSGNHQERFLFIEGKRSDRVVLVAHADTVFEWADKHYVIEDEGYFKAIDKSGMPSGLGADDRAGCAILWLLKDMGHSILILDGEERGMKGARYLMSDHKDLADKLNNEHQFMIEFDRRNSKDFKTYSVGSSEFEEYIQQETGFRMPDRWSYTDIITLCKVVCGVNLSVGYYGEHTFSERIKISEWQNTLEIARALLSKEQHRFEQEKYLYQF